eukprot:4253329-Prymnesium_polylepis.1
MAVTLRQQELNSMRKVYLPGDFVYHLAGGGLSGSVEKRRTNPKYAFLLAVCHAAGPRATSADRAAMERTLANFTDHSRAVSSKAKGERFWPPIARAYYAPTA